MAEFWLFIVLFCAFLCGVIATSAFFWLSKRYALSIVRQNANASGRAKQEAQQNRTMEAITELISAFKDGKEQGKDIKETIKEVMPSMLIKYPDVALQLGKQLKNKNFDLSGLSGLSE